MKKVLVILSFLFAGINCFAQFYTENGVVYCDSDYLIIGRIQANFDDDMAVCQHPSGYALMILDKDNVLVTVDLGKTKEQAIENIDEFTKLATQKVSARQDHFLKNMEDNDVRMTVYPSTSSYLHTKVMLYCPSTGLGAGIVLVNNLHYFHKVLVKYPTVPFKPRNTLSLPNS